jgi:predicted transposase YbfD/YdcC
VGRRRRTGHRTTLLQSNDATTSVASIPRSYISSLDPDAEALLKAMRRHWHIENRMHRVLDVVFREDQSRIRAGHAAQNMATAEHGHSETPCAQPA